VSSSPARSLQRLLSIPEVADTCGVSGSTVRRLIRAGRLPALRVGGQIRVEARDLEWFFAASHLPRNTETNTGG
jgi:excisionase family DNA binding protein